MGSVSAPDGIQEPAPSERRTPPNPRSDEVFASPLAAPKLSVRRDPNVPYAIKKALFSCPTRAFVFLEGLNVAFQESLQGRSTHRRFILANALDAATLWLRRFRGHRQIGATRTPCYCQNH